MLNPVEDAWAELICLTRPSISCSQKSQCCLCSVLFPDSWPRKPGTPAESYLVLYSLVGVSLEPLMWEGRRGESLYEIEDKLGLDHSMYHGVYPGY